MELDLETGRKNQIRVHMQDLGHLSLVTVDTVEKTLRILSDALPFMHSNSASIIR